MLLRLVVVALAASLVAATIDVPQPRVNPLAPASGWTDAQVCQHFKRNYLDLEEDLLNQYDDFVKYSRTLIPKLKAGSKGRGATYATKEINTMKQKARDMLKQLEIQQMTYHIQKGVALTSSENQFTAELIKAMLDAGVQSGWNAIQQFQFLLHNFHARLAQHLIRNKGNLGLADIRELHDKLIPQPAMFYRRLSGIANQTATIVTPEWSGIPLTYHIEEYTRVLPPTPAVREKIRTLVDSFCELPEVSQTAAKLPSASKSEKEEL
jgi:hypothetical protein